MRRILRFLAAAALICAALASPSAATAQIAESDADSPDILFRQFNDAATERKYQEALKIAARIDRIKGDNELRAWAAGARATALIGLRRDAEAGPLIAEVERRHPVDAMPTIWMINAARFAKRYDLERQLFDLMLSRYPHILRKVRPSWVVAVLRRAPLTQKIANDDRIISLARIGFGGEQGDDLTRKAVRALLSRGDVASATDFLRFIDDPEVIADMLTDRRFEPLWPALERSAGPHLQNAVNASVEAARRAYDLDPDDHEKFAAFAAAKLAARDFDGVIALRSKLPATSAAMAKVDENIGWVVNSVATAYYQTGRPEDADALFALLNEAPMRPENWRISMKINRALILVDRGQFARALPLLEAAASLEMSPYAEQLIRTARYCSLIGLGRIAEAAAALTDLRAHESDALTNSIDALLCGGDAEAAEKLTLAKLPSDDDFLTGFIRDMQPFSSTARRPMSGSEKRAQAFRMRTAIASAFEKYGRDLPERLRLQ